MTRKRTFVRDADAETFVKQNAPAFTTKATDKATAAPAAPPMPPVPLSTRVPHDLLQQLYRLQAARREATGTRCTMQDLVVEALRDLVAKGGS